MLHHISTSRMLFRTLGLPTCGLLLALNHVAAATVTNLTLEPASGPPGSVVFVNGAGFSPVFLSNHVAFNGSNAAAVVSATPSQLAVIVPANLGPGDAFLSVTVGGLTNVPAKFQVTPMSGLELSVSRSNTDAVVSWPATPAGALLESTASLHPPVTWTPVTNAGAVVAGRREMKLAPGQTARFFRLRNAAVPGDSQSGGASTGHGMVSASSGGSIATDDQSATLVIPPGALAQDTDIQVISVHVPGVDDPSAGGDVLLSPEGLTFSQPVTLKLQLPANPPDGFDLGVELLSGENAPIDVGGETSYFQTVSNYLFNGASAQLEVPLSHFSGVSWFFAKKLYAVLNIPGKYLKKGDLIYALTDATQGQGGTWYPGHCGLYLGTQSAISDVNDGDTIIESTQTHDIILGEVRFDSLHSSGLPAFDNLNGTHIYMGARRPLNFEPRDNERTEAADWAIAQLGKRYAIIGGGAFLANDAPLFDGFTCVGLTEQAYEFGMGKRIVPWQAARVIFTPFRQFQWTRPVDTAEIEVGDSFDAHIVGVAYVRAPGNFFKKYYSSDQYYTRALNLDGCNIEAREALAAKRATFEPVFGVLSFTPAKDDAGRNFRFAFTIDGSASDVGVEHTAITVKVKTAEGLLTRQAPTFTGEGWTPVGSEGKPPVFTFTGWLAAGLTAPGAQVTPSNAVVTVLSGGKTTILKFSWPEPPETLSTNGGFDFPITAEVSGDFTDLTLRAQATANYANSAGATARIVGKRATAGFARIPGSNDFKPNPVSTTSTFPASGPTGAAGTPVLRNFQIVIDGVLGLLQATVRWDYTSPPPP